MESVEFLLVSDGSDSDYLQYLFVDKYLKLLTSKLIAER
jgi:hypothetical protein